MFEGNQPPAMVPRKGDYMVNDLQRMREYAQVPINQPKVGTSFCFYFINSKPKQTRFKKNTI